MSHEIPKCFPSYEEGQKATERDCENCLSFSNCSAIAEGLKHKRKTAADILIEMGNTYRERNAVYGDNYKMVGKLMAVLFPDGAPKELLHSDQFHLFELVLVKISRLAISNLTHIDSVHDSAVYCAMIEAIIRQQQEQ